MKYLMSDIEQMSKVERKRLCQPGRISPELGNLFDKFAEKQIEEIEDQLTEAALNHINTHSDSPGAFYACFGDVSAEDINAEYTSVINRRGVSINYDAAVEMMDDEIRDEIHAELAPCSDQDFFDEYAERHKAKFGEVWELDKANPVY